MPGLSDTIARLSALRAMPANPARSGGAKLVELPEIGTNPGALRARLYIPEQLAANAPLVVVLHGCTQTADEYDRGSGWSQLADRYGFALLFPEQQRQNNPNLCFNWFLPTDSRRASGEALSIREMIATMVQRHAIDSARIYVTGLSAGGAMASVMLATYPEVFAGGAIIAGVAYGCANSIPQAFDRMRGHALPGAAELAASVRGASAHAGPWPTISVWHGGNDATVSPLNAAAIIDQWRGLHGVGANPNRVEQIDGTPRRVWCDAKGRAVIEEYTITGMGHGTPLDTARADGCGQRGAFMLEAGISSTHHICHFWGLDGDDGRVEAASATSHSSLAPKLLLEPADTGTPRLSRIFAKAPAPKAPGATDGVAKVIEDALRAAGLMR